MLVLTAQTQKLLFYISVMFDKHNTITQAIGLKKNFATKFFLKATYKYHSCIIHIFIIQFVAISLKTDIFSF